MEDFGELRANEFLTQWHILMPMSHFHSLSLSWLYIESQPIPPDPLETHFSRWWQVFHCWSQYKQSPPPSVEIMGHRGRQNHFPQCFDWCRGCFTQPCAEQKLLRSWKKMSSVTSLYVCREVILFQKSSKMVSLTCMPQLTRGYPLKPSKLLPPTLLQLI
jgi:hypothetical protein